MTTSIDSQSNFKLKLGEHVSLQNFDKQTVLYCKRTGSFFGLNPSACVLLQKLLDTDLYQTAAFASGQYKVDEARVRGDLRVLVEQLSQKQLVTAAPLASE